VANESAGQRTRSGARPVTLVDSSVLLDIRTEDPGWVEWSSESLIRAADEGHWLSIRSFTRRARYDGHVTLADPEGNEFCLMIT